MDLSKIRTHDEFMDAARRAGATITDGPVGPEFVKGWAHVVSFRSRALTAHYFTMHAAIADPRRVTSACGLKRYVTKRVPLLTAGNLPFCTRCENALMKARRP